MHLSALLIQRSRGREKGGKGRRKKISERNITEQASLSSTFAQKNRVHEGYPYSSTNQNAIVSSRLFRSQNSMLFNDSLLKEPFDVQ